jgi:hypothetical protein
MSTKFKIQSWFSFFTIYQKQQTNNKFKYHLQVYNYVMDGRLNASWRTIKN